MTKNNKQNYDQSFLIQLLRKMLLIRRFEEQAGKQYRLRKIGGFCHLYIGQEAVCTGAIATLDLSIDYVIAAYREHGHALACGMSANSIMAELYGKKTGCVGGKGGSMHLFSVAHHMYGGHGIVGSHLPLATGMAFKLNYSNDNGVVLCFFGDGAVNMGTYHESLSMAKIWNLPIVFICENNEYAMGTHFRRVSPIEELYKKSQSYGIEGIQVNGMDVLEVYQEVSKAILRARKKEPVFLEIKTYRYRGHSMSDPAKYRDKGELEKYKQQDPILLFKEKLISQKHLDEKNYNILDEEVKKEIKESIVFAEQSSEPELDQLHEHMYV